MRAVEAEALLHELDKLRRLALALVQQHELLEVVRVHDDLQARDSGEAVLARGHASRVHLLPRRHGVGLLRRLHRLAVLLQVDVAQRQLGVVVHGREEELCRGEEALVKAALAHRLDGGHVRRRNELLEVAELVRLGVGVDQRRVHVRLLDLGPRHDQVRHQRLVRVVALRRLDHLDVVRSVLGLDVRRHGRGEQVARELRLRQTRPHGGHVHALRKRARALQVADQVHEDGHGGDVQLRRVADGLVARGRALGELGVDDKALLVQSVLVGNRDFRDLRAVEVVEAVDVLHDALLVRLDGREDQKVLEVFVLGKV
mmetsp:Transcript_20034/g.67858  ORF Transcript_20034/g.67858 Transcript_20034/m.67858 type:complete len:315 (+) Transcript_20034:1372-2316(+)